MTPSSDLPRILRTALLARRTSARVVLARTLSGACWTVSRAARASACGLIFLIPLECPNRAGPGLNDRRETPGLTLGVGVRAPRRSRHCASQGVPQQSSRPRRCLGSSRKRKPKVDQRSGPICCCIRAAAAAAPTMAWPSPRRESPARDGGDVPLATARARAAANQRRVARRLCEGGVVEGDRLGLAAATLQEQAVGLHEDAAHGVLIGRHGLEHRLRLQRTGLVAFQQLCSRLASRGRRSRRSDFSLRAPRWRRRCRRQRPRPRASDSAAAALWGNAHRLSGEDRRRPGDPLPREAIASDRSDQPAQSRTAPGRGRGRRRRLQGHGRARHVTGQHGAAKKAFSLHLRVARDVLAAWAK